MNIDLIWAAGFIDGEGHVSIRKCQKYAMYGILVANTNRAALERLQALFNGGHIYEQTRYPNRKLCFSWALLGKKVIPAAEALLPYLFVKANEMRCLLDFAEQYKSTRGDNRARAIVIETYTTAIKDIRR